MPNLKDQYDLTVIGGGPAGTAAAITAARAGAKVLLLERGRFPRHKVCGEFVSAESLELLSTLLGPAHALLAEDVRIAQARIFLDGRILRTQITPPAASIARFDLDEALWKSAIHSGVQAQEQTTVQQIMVQQIMVQQTTVQQSAGGLFRITTSAGECATRAVINATGRWSNLNSAPNRASSEDDSLAREKWLGVKAHFAERSPSESVDLYFFDGGYCGVQPLTLGSADGAGSVNACAMVRAEVARTLPEVFLRHPALHERSLDWQPLSEPVSTSPLIFRTPQPCDGNTLRVGDAAGFVDPFVGDGISLALRGGALAAEALIPFFRQETTLEAAAASYSGSYEQRLAPVFRNSSRIRQALLLPKALRAPALFVMQRIPALTQHLVNMTR